LTRPPAITPCYPNGPRPAVRRGSGARASSGLRGRARPRPKGRGAHKTGRGALGVAIPLGMCRERVRLPPVIPRDQWRRRKADLCQERNSVSTDCQTRCVFQSAGFMRDRSSLLGPRGACWEHDQHHSTTSEEFRACSALPLGQTPGPPRRRARTR